MSENIPGYFDSDGKFVLSAPLKTRFGIVPTGFKTDGFSIPWWLRWFHHPFGKGLAGAILHDYLLEQQDKRANRMFFVVIREKGINIVKAVLMYLVVAIYQNTKRFIVNLIN